MESHISETFHSAEFPAENIRSLSAPLVLALLMGLAFAAFGQALVNGYAYDGNVLVEAVSGVGRADLGILVDPKEYNPTTRIMSWRPLTALGYIVFDNWLVAGTAAFSHALNIACHAMNGFLLFLILRMFPDRKGRESETAALVASAIFVVHPLVSETVLCAGFRGDINALNFALLGLLLVVSSDLTGRHWMLAPATIAILLALGFKEIGYIALPLAPVLAWMFATNQKPLKALVPAIFLGAACLLFFTAWRLFRYESAAANYLGGNGRALGVANFLVSCWEIYILRLFLPSGLRVDHHFVPIESMTGGRFLFAFISLSVIGCLLLVAARRIPVILPALCFLFFGFLPVSQVTIIPDPVAERFCYVPMAGVAFLLYAFLSAALKTDRLSRPAVTWAAALLVTILIVFSHIRSLDWRDDFTLNIADWERAEPGRDRALALATLHFSRSTTEPRGRHFPRRDEDIAEARRQLNEMLQQNPADFEAHRILAIVLSAAGEPADSLEHIRKALSLAPQDEQVRATARALGVFESEDDP